MTLTSCTHCGFDYGPSGKSEGYCPSCGELMASNKPMTRGRADKTIPIAPQGINSSTGKQPKRTEITAVQVPRQDQTVAVTNLDQPQDPPATPSPEMPSTIGEYQILSTLGEGGMGIVYLAHEPLLNRLVAIKVLRKNEKAQQSIGASKFISESVLTGKLSHGGIIPIHRIGYDINMGFYYVMRYLKGRTLMDILSGVREGVRADVEAYPTIHLLNILSRACEAIGFAHRNGVIHQDLKPANIMVSEYGEVLVLDWGLAKEIKGQHKGQFDLKELGQQKNVLIEKHNHSTRIFLKKTSVESSSSSKLKQILSPSQPIAEDKAFMETNVEEGVVGTPAYMSPEQGRGINTEPPSDVYAFGVMLYEILTGRIPVDEQNPAKLIARTIQGKITPISKQPEAARTPKALCNIVTRALSLKPEDRFENASMLAKELQLYIEGRSPLKLIAKDRCNKKTLADIWIGIQGRITPGPDGIIIPAQSKMTCSQKAQGTFRMEFEAQPELEEGPWAVELAISEFGGSGHMERRYAIKLGVRDSPFLELWEKDRRLLRRFDLRVQKGARFKATLDFSLERIEFALNGRTVIEYQEFFPQIGGAIHFKTIEGTTRLLDFKFHSQGAPLHLPFMNLPDRLFRDGNFSEAREMYRSLAKSHPDRDEGMLAQYKAGLCSAEMNDSHRAMEELSKLEGTMYEHCCVFGWARIGLLEKKTNWALSVLKAGYKSQPIREIKAQLWFAMLNLIESLGEEQHEQRKKRYADLLRDLKPEPHECTQVAFDLLDPDLRAGNWSKLRDECISLLAQFPENTDIACAALCGLSRAGASESVLLHADKSLKRVLQEELQDDMRARMNILYAEVLMAQRKLREAESQLQEALFITDAKSPLRMWAKGWEQLAIYFREDFKKLIDRANESIERFEDSAFGMQAYFNIMKGLGLAGLKRKNESNESFQKAAQIKGLWGSAAKAFLKKESLQNWGRDLASESAAHLMEAIFLIAEAHVLNGNEKLAASGYVTCMAHPCERALFKEIAKERLSLIGVQKQYENNLDRSG